MGDIYRGKRPLSPFMIGPYYKPQITSITSILTRITGIALLFTGLLVVWWFLAAAAGPEAFETANWWLTSYLGDLIMLLSLIGFWYHFCAGLRHLYWDTGRGLELETAEKLGWACLIASVVMTLFTIIIV